MVCSLPLVQYTTHMTSVLQLHAAEHGESKAISPDMLHLRMNA